MLFISLGLYLLPLSCENSNPYRKAVSKLSKSQFLLSWNIAKAVRCSYLKSWHFGDKRFPSNGDRICASISVRQEEAHVAVDKRDNTPLCPLSENTEMVVQQIRHPELSTRRQGAVRWTDRLKSAAFIEEAEVSSLTSATWTASEQTQIHTSQRVLSFIHVWTCMHGLNVAFNVRMPYVYDQQCDLIVLTMFLLICEDTASPDAEHQGPYFIE